MEENFSFNRNLNWKKVIIVAIILIIIICLVLFFILRNKETSTPILNISTTSSFIDNTNTIKFDLPKKYNLKQFYSDSNHVLELKSSDNLYILVSFEGLFAGHSIMDIISRDRDSYLSNYEGTSNVSNITEEQLNNLAIYYYSFDYINYDKTYTLETIWIESSIGYFIIDVNYLTEDSEKYANLHSDILNSFSFIEKDELDFET